MSTDSAFESARGADPVPAITAETIALAPPPMEERAVGETPDAASLITPAAAAGEGPRIRWAGIVWGLFFAAMAFGGLWIVTDRARRGSIIEWASTLTPGAIVAYALLAIGVLVLIAGVVGLLRRGQVLLARRRSAS